MADQDSFSTPSWMVAMLQGHANEEGHEIEWSGDNPPTEEPGPYCRTCAAMEA